MPPGHCALLLVTVFVCAAVALPSTASDPILVPLTYQTQDYEFFAELGLGTPQQSFRLLIDTGSANLWVPGVSCTDAACKARTAFDPAQSQTSRALAQPPVSILYGGAQVTATLVSDIVSLPGGAAFRQTFGVATSMASQAAIEGGRAPWDGLLGLGRQALASGDAPIPLTSMVEQGVTSQPVLALYLARNPSAPGRGGEMALGGWNPARLQGDITWVDVVEPPPSASEEGYWSLQLRDLQLAWPNGTSVAPPGMCSTPGSSTPGSSSSSGGGAEGSCVVILDSGTSQIIGSLDQVAALNAALGGQPAAGAGLPDCPAQVARVIAATLRALSGPAPARAANQVCQQLYPSAQPDSPEWLLCSNVQLQLASASEGAQTPAQAQAAAAAVCGQLPYASNVSFACEEVGGLPNISLSLGAGEFTLTPRDYAFESPRGGCFSAISALGSLGPGLVLGQAFLAKYYSIFDLSQPPGRVGLAQLSAAEQRQAAASAGAAPGGGGGAASRAALTALVLALLLLLLL